MVVLRNNKLCASCHFANETHRIVTADKVMTPVAIWGNNQQKGSHLFSSSMVLPWKLELCPLVWFVEEFPRLEFAWWLKGRA